jgi:hypothetical protein
LAASLLELGRRRLDLDHVRAELGGDLSGVGDDVDRRLALLRQAAAARVAPDDDGEADGLRLLDQLAELHVHLVRASPSPGRS